MATVFPFNQLPSIIPQIQQQLFPIINNVQSQLTSQAIELQNSILSISPNVSCNDVEIAQIRNQIERINQLISNVESILSFLPTLVNTLDIISTAARIISSAQLLIPVGPPASISQLILSSAETLDRIENLVSILQTSVSSWSSTFSKVSSVIAEADNLLLNVCGSASDFNGLGNLQTNASIQLGLSLDDLATLYPDNFYREINVTDQDIQQRLQLISELLEDGLVVAERLNNAPSEILSGNTDPNNTIGKTGDYFINTTTGIIFGPKPTDSAWL
jgi:hypothetical protein